MAGNPQILHSKHGRDFGFGYKNELIVRDAARGGRDDAQVLIWSVARVEIDTADVLTLRATPIEIVAAPGALKAIIVDHVEVFLDFNTVAYVDEADEDLSFRYTDENGIEVCAPLDGSDFIDSAVDISAYSPGIITDAAQGFVPTVNAAVVATTNTGEVETGNSPLFVHMYYRIVDTVLTL